MTDKNEGTTEQPQAPALERRYLGRGATVSTTDLAGNQVELAADAHGYITPASPEHATLLDSFVMPEGEGEALASAGDTVKAPAKPATATESAAKAQPVASAANTVSTPTAAPSATKKTEA